MILFINAGVYMLHDSVIIPAGSRVVGECWATFAAVGEAFSDPKYVSAPSLT